MAFKKGISGNPKGKPKGAINKINKAVKEVISETFNELQADSKNNMLAWAKQNPTEFYKLASKLLPTEVDTSINSEPKKILVHRVSFTNTRSNEPNTHNKGFNKS
jgi:Family of unknown function (DUF5681)